MNEKKLIHLQFGEKSKAIKVTLVKASGGGLTVYDAVKNLSYGCDESQLTQALVDTGEELRLMVEKELAATGSLKPLTIVISVHPGLPVPPNFGFPQQSNPMILLANAFGLNQTYPATKEGFLKLAEDVKQEVPDNINIVDLYQASQQPVMLGDVTALFNAMGGYPGIPNFDVLRQQSKSKFGNAENTIQQEDQEGIIHLK